MKTKRFSALLLALVLCLSLCACGSADKSAQYEAREAGEYYDYYEPAQIPAPMQMSAAYDMDVEMAMEDSGLAMMNTAATGAKKAAGAESGDTPVENPEKIIYSGDATVETTEFDRSIAALEEMIAREGGFIESSSVNGSNYYDTSRGRASRRSASYTLRIPSERFSALMGSLSDIGNVPYTHTYTENVTAQYYDVQARLKALQAQEARLVEMLSIAETVEDIITIEDKLSDVRYRIDSHQSSLNNWDRRVAYSSLSVTVKEVQEYTPEKVTKLSYGQELALAFRDALKNAGQFFKDLLVWLVSALPTLVILTALFFVFRPLLKKLSARNKERRAKRAAERAAIIAAKKAGIQDAKIEEQKKP